MKEYRYLTKKPTLLVSRFGCHPMQLIWFLYQEISLGTKHQNKTSMKPGLPVNNKEEAENTDDVSMPPNIII
jgi:hypothetical protein